MDLWRTRGTGKRSVSGERITLRRRCCLLLSLTARSAVWLLLPRRIAPRPCSRRLGLIDRDRLGEGRGRRRDNAAWRSVCSCWLRGGG